MVDLNTNELAALEVELRQATENLGFEAHPFKIGWYNESVGEKFTLPYDDNTLAFVIISQPSMFEKAFLPFISDNLEDLDKVSFQFLLTCRTCEHP
jgi:hypothetical protein